MAAADTSPGPGWRAYDDIVIKDRMPGDDYAYGPTLGAGGFGDVFEATDRGTGMRVAMKFSKTTLSSRVMDDARREVVMMDRMMSVTRRHPNLLKQYRVYEFADAQSASGTCIAMVLQYWDGGSLLQHVMRQPSGRMPESAAPPESVMGAKFSFAQMAQGLKAMHEADGTGSFVHCDIKLDNMLLETPTVTSRELGVPTALLGDFGETVWVPHLEGGSPGTYSRTTFKGTLEYAAPEQLTRGADGTHTYSAATDIWGLGVSLYCALNGRFPFGRPGKLESSARAIFNERVMAGSATPCRGSVSAEARDLIRQMLSVDPAARPSAAGVLQHPWLAEGVKVAAKVAESREAAYLATEFGCAGDAAERVALRRDAVTGRATALREHVRGVSAKTLRVMAEQLDAILGPDADYAERGLSGAEFQAFVNGLGFEGLLVERIFVARAGVGAEAMPVHRAADTIAIIKTPGDERVELAFCMYCTTGETHITPAGLAEVLDSLRSDDAETLAVAKENLALRLNELDLDASGRLSREQLRAAATRDPYLIKLMMQPVPNFRRFPRIRQEDGSLAVPPGMSEHAGGESLAASPWWSVVSAAHTVDWIAMDEDGEVLSQLAAALSAIAELLEDDLIGDEEAMRYRSMGMEGDVGLLAAMEVFAVDHDRDELADTLRRVVAIADAPASRVAASSSGHGTSCGLRLEGRSLV